jgi:hypothetical protein
MLFLNPWEHPTPCPARSKQCCANLWYCTAPAVTSGGKIIAYLGGISPFACYSDASERPDIVCITTHLETRPSFSLSLYLAYLLTSCVSPDLSETIPFGTLRDSHDRCDAEIS